MDQDSNKQQISQFEEQIISGPGLSEQESEPYLRTDASIKDKLNFEKTLVEDIKEEEKMAPTRTKERSGSQEKTEGEVITQPFAPEMTEQKDSKDFSTVKKQVQNKEIDDEDDSGDNHPLLVYFQPQHPSDYDQKMESAEKKENLEKSNKFSQSDLSGLIIGSSLIQEKQGQESQKQEASQSTKNSKDQQNMFKSKNQTSSQNSLSARENESNLQILNQKHGRAPSFKAQSHEKQESLQGSLKSKNIGLQSIHGSIEASPHLKQVPGNQNKSSNSYKSPRSAQMSSEANSSSKHLSNPVDQYTFLGGIREIDDEHESLSQQTQEQFGNRSSQKGISERIQGNKGSTGSSQKFFQGRSLQESIQSTNRQNKDDSNKIMYGTVQAQATNPFMQYKGTSVHWSAGNENLSERQPSFGGGEQTPSQNISEQSPAGYDVYEENSNGNRANPLNVEKLLTKAYHQSLAAMGEKACMRLTLKEIASTLEVMNEMMCKQTVQQELLLSDETPTNQMKIMMDMSVQHNNIQQKIYNKIQECRRKNNVELMDQLKMESQMMIMRFRDFQEKEDNIYKLFVKERIQKQNQYDHAKSESNQNQIQLIGPEQAPQYYQTGRQGSTSMYHNTVLSDWIDTEAQKSQTGIGTGQFKRDVNETSQNEHHRLLSVKPIHSRNQMTHVPSIEQLSPGSPFNVRQSPIVITPSPEKIEQNTLTGESHRQSISHLQDVQQALGEKDKQIQNLIEYVDAIKREFNQYRQSFSQRGLSMRVSNDDELDQSQSKNVGDSTFPVETDYHEKIVELHTQIYKLKNDNQNLENQLRSVQGSQIIKVEDGIENLKKDKNLGDKEIKFINMDSSSSKKYSYSAMSQSPSYIQSSTQQNQHSTHIVQDQASLKKSTTHTIGQKLSIAQLENQKIKVGGQSIDEPSGHSQNQDLQGFIQHGESIGSSNPKVNELMEQLDKQARISKRLDQNELKLLEKIKLKDQQFSDLQELTRELQSQNKINAEALEKAGLVIQKLNEEIQQNEQDLGVLKNDAVHRQNQMNQQLTNYQQREKAGEANLQRIQNELQLQLQDLSDKLATQSTEFNQEREQLLLSNQTLKQEYEKAENIKTSLEQKMMADKANFNSQIQQKTTEALDYHNQNLSLQIQMKTCVDQTREDLLINQEIHQREIIFLKNTINQLEQQIRANTQNNSYYSDQMTKTKTRFDQDGSEIPKVNGAYLSQLAQEFTVLSKEIHRIQQITREKSTAQIESYLSKYMKNFNEFKQTVLEGLQEWHSKSKGLAQLATKYMDTLEEYKMMFIQMKQHLKEKDSIIRKTRNQLEAVKNTSNIHNKDIAQEYERAHKLLMNEFKNTVEGKENELNEKSDECEKLVKYMNDFKQEYMKVCDERDDLRRRNEVFIAQNDQLGKEMQILQKGIFDFKDQLRTILDVQEGTFSSEILHQHAKVAMETVKSNRGQIKFLQEKINDLSLELEKQREFFKLKMDENQQCLESTQNKYLTNLDESNKNYSIKEEKLEQKITELTNELEGLKHESNIRDRQIKKHESKLEDEAKKQVDLQIELDHMTGEKNKLQDAKEAISQSYDVLQAKLNTTQEFLDSKIKMISEFEQQSRDLNIQNEKVDLQLKEANRIIDDRNSTIMDLKQQIDRQKKEMLTTSDQLRFERDENNALTKDNNKLKMNEKLIIDSNENHIQKLAVLEQENKVKEAELIDLRQEMKRYENTVTFMNRQLDEEKLKLLDAAILQTENQKLKDTILVKEDVIENLHKQYVNRPKREVDCQTDNQIVIENYHLRSEIQTMRHVVNDHEGEMNHLKDAMARQIQDIDRLIEEKRQLENELQESQNREKSYRHFGNENTNINNQQAANTSNMNQAIINQSLPPNIHTSFNKSFQYNNINIENHHQLQLILAEKDNYIERLNTELNELRIENERLKDKLIVFELDNIEKQTHYQSQSKIYGQPTMVSTHDKSIAYMNNSLRQQGVPNERGFVNTQQFQNQVGFQDNSGIHQTQNTSLERANFGYTNQQNFLSSDQNLSSLPSRTPQLGTQAYITPTLDQDNDQFYSPEDAANLHRHHQRLMNERSRQPMNTYTHFGQDTSNSYINSNVRSVTSPNQNTINFYTQKINPEFSNTSMDNGTRQHNQSFNLYQDQ